MERTSDLIWQNLASPVPSGAIPFAGRVLLLASVTCSLVWFPVLHLGAWTIAGSDTALIGLWATVGLDMVLRGISNLDGRTPLIVILAIAIALLAGLGAELSLPEGNGPLEFALFMKRFGLASVIPLAAQRFRSPSAARWVCHLTFVAMAALVAFTVWPELASFLPRPESYEGLSSDRAVGLGTNANDLAYTATAASVLHGAFLPRRPRQRDLLLLSAVLVGAGICLIASGSRSGLLGATAALAFLLLRSEIRVRTKLVLSIGFGLMVFVGFSASLVFQERLDRVLSSGVHEQNLFARISAQEIALRTFLKHPFGVGFRNIDWATLPARENREIATTDSLYLDTLLGAGPIGLLALLLLLRTCWKHIGVTGGGSRCADALRAGFLAFLVFGAATVVPVSVFLSPLFFTIVSGASHVRAADG